MTNVIKMHLLLRVYADIFPKTPRFFTISFNQVNDVDVKIYETQLEVFSYLVAETND
jgi:hypothetical protein